jgi:hypothetical protein
MSRPAVASFLACLLAVAACAGANNGAASRAAIDADLLLPSARSAASAQASVLPAVSLRTLVPSEGLLAIDMAALAHSDMAFVLLPRIDTVFGARLGLAERTSAPCLGARCGANVPLAPKVRWAELALAATGPVADALVYESPSPLPDLLEQSSRAWPDRDNTLPPGSTLVRMDGGPRVAIAPRQGEVLIVARDRAAGVAQALGAARLGPSVPQAKGLLASLEFAGTPRWLPVRPPGLRQTRVELRHEPEGGLWLRSRLRFDDEAQALIATGLLRRALDDAMDEPVARFLLGEWLRSATVESTGPELRLDANGPKENVLRVLDLVLLSRGL